MSKTALITGIGGQDGSYLAESLLEHGYEVHGILRRASVPNTGRIDHIKDRLKLHLSDLTDAPSISGLVQKIKPSEIYNLGAQSHVRISFDCPSSTVASIVGGTLNLLEALRHHCPEARFYQASSSEMFGAVLETPQRETTPFNPASPYGAAKAGAHFLAKNYREAYGLHISNGILFNHECLTSETPVVFRRNGWVDVAEIGEIVAHRTDPDGVKKCQSFPDLEVWDGGNWSRVTCATATWVDGDKQLFRVQARGGLYCATEDHQSFLEGRKEIGTSELKTGDRLQLYPLPEGGGDALMSEGEAEFLGLMVGDGYMSKDGRATFTNKDEALLARCGELFSALTGGKVRRGETVSGFTGEAIPVLHFSGAGSQITFWRGELYNERGLKKVPKRVLNARKSTQILFLRGYNNADGLKAGKCNREFKGITTNSAVLAAGVWLLFQAQGWRTTMNWEPRGYIHLNVGEYEPSKGAHLLKPLEEIKSCEPIDYRGWVFDLATESGTFSAGVGLTWVHNSPRRGVEFVTRKISLAVARIARGMQENLKLGNLDAKRDWGHSKEFVEGMRMMLGHETPGDYVLATGETHTVREFVESAFALLGMDWRKYVVIDPSLLRPTEVDLLLGDPSKARNVLGWIHNTSFDELVHEMVVSDYRATAGK